jgi:uncharacterized membrane protein YkoI
MTLLQRTDLRGGRKAALALITLILFVVPAAAVKRLAFRADIRPVLAAATTEQPIAAVAGPPASQNVTQEPGAAQHGTATDPEQQKVKVRVRAGGDSAGWMEGYRLAQVERRKVEEGNGDAQERVKLSAEEQEKRSAQEKEEVETHARRERAEFEAMTPEQREAFVKERQKAFAQRRAELLKQAKLTMQQAMEVALREQPGTLIGCNLVRERDTAMYVAEIVSGNDDDAKTVRLLIDAGNGQIVNKSEMLPRVRIRGELRRPESGRE